MDPLPPPLNVMAKVADSHTCMDFKTSGVAKLGHTRVRALATGGCAPSVQVLLKIIGAECTVINRELGAKSAQRC